jgi:hypothetical protein
MEDTVVLALTAASMQTDLVVALGDIQVEATMGMQEAWE